MLFRSVRINYENLGNQLHHIHWHVIPRYADEPEKLRTAHPWAYDWNAAPLFERAAYTDLAESLYRELTKMGCTKPMRFFQGTPPGGSTPK